MYNRHKCRTRPYDSKKILKKFPTHFCQCFQKKPHECRFNSATHDKQEKKMIACVGGECRNMCQQQPITTVERFSMASAECVRYVYTSQVNNNCWIGYLAYGAPLLPSVVLGGCHQFISRLTSWFPIGDCAINRKFGWLEPRCCCHWRLNFVFY